jgi:galactose-1-phosphate uridylyltransferase
METTENPDVILQSIWDNLHASMAALDSGGSIDMTIVDKQVRTFCDKITKLPPATAKSYNEKLTDIIAYLNNIVDKLSQHKNHIEDEIIMLNQRHKAHNAYGSSNITNNTYSEGE